MELGNEIPCITDQQAKILFIWSFPGSQTFNPLDHNRSNKIKRTRQFNHYILDVQCLGQFFGCTRKPLFSNLSLTYYYKWRICHKCDCIPKDSNKRIESFCLATSFALRKILWSTRRLIFVQRTWSPKFTFFISNCPFDSHVFYSSVVSRLSLRS